MDYKEALKKYQSEKKTKENYLLIKFNYDTQLVLPYKEGIAVLEALGQAEHFKENYSEGVRINPLPKEVVQTHIISQDEYRRIKIAMLLNIKPHDLEALEAQAA